ncbi:DUF2158 domain-containing protein [Flavobacterium psychrophilum]|uniref:DUF2158 domain-containing protein n=1 Tax=Flavobacterium psychrophilum TaxID=96345 RepID=UPI001C8F95EC|nr:DUF2158 domain-containing protein [Flavobacterium psychrophilum]EKT4500013.1 DUF2158 domain-containing protein [Flavobacterium psychrophilum]EKT4520791.1 DUF2158 domain-containing protein [Flavobacterium psychrophilum]ELM3651580.1 DUF2158 domain-containing protein [Flavobacterium psychrophilum]ELM3672602.1 DUF2158 domain-containing protein [Flavobacterium psychrophilum]ELM3727144.1 DUF2158 domain-containing protein [Flavobacterium psychrophilum]
MILEIGEVVQLKSGGEKMTVQRIIGKDSQLPRIAMEDKLLKLTGYEDGDVCCQWFVNKKLESSVFKKEMLIIFK